MNNNYHAGYYDMFKVDDADIEFYKNYIKSNTQVLDLGCGSGRVSFPLSDIAGSVYGVDSSKEMISAARNKGCNDNLFLIESNISTLNLDQEFDLIIAPFRVFQEIDVCLENDFFQVIEKHLKTDGICILNVYDPSFVYTREEIAAKWLEVGGTVRGETELSDGGVVKYFDRRLKSDEVLQELYAELVYQTYCGDELIDEHVNSIKQRYFYPDQFLDLISSYGFEVDHTWGGYNHQDYGKGPELIVAFKKGASESAGR